MDHGERSFFHGKPFLLYGFHIPISLAWISSMGSGLWALSFSVTIPPRCPICFRTVFYKSTKASVKTKLKSLQNFKTAVEHDPRLWLWVAHKWSLLYCHNCGKYINYYCGLVAYKFDLLNNYAMLRKHLLRKCIPAYANQKTNNKMLIYVCRYLYWFFNGRFHHKCGVWQIFCAFFPTDTNLTVPSFWIIYHFRHNHSMYLVQCSNVWLRVTSLSFAHHRLLTQLQPDEFPNRVFFSHAYII